MRQTERQGRADAHRPARRAWLPAGLLLAGLLLGMASGPGTVRAQLGGLGPDTLVDSAPKVVGYALWYSRATIHMEAAADNATTAVRGYTSAIPGRLKSQGPSLSISFAKWGLNLGFNEGNAPVNARADVNQTPGNTADDPYVISMRRTSRTTSVLFNPLRWLYLGYGKETGTVEFQQVTAAGQQETHRLGFSGDFYSFGLAAGFDPRRNDFGLVFNVFAKIPTSHTDFSGSEFGAGVGFFL